MELPLLYACLTAGAISSDKTDLCLSDKDSGGLRIAIEKNKVQKAIAAKERQEFVASMLRKAKNG